MSTHQTHPAEFFDENHAATYDERFAKLSPLRDAMEILIRAFLADEPENARVLCVGAGTGTEIINLGASFPHWHFTAVEPSAPMLEVCRRKLGEAGFETRCDFHEGFLESLPSSEPFDLATCILVSHFILDAGARRAFLRDMADRLVPGGCLIHVDLAFDPDSPAFPSLLQGWLRMLKGAELSPEDIETLRQTYQRDVVLWPPERIAEALVTVGFETPVPFFQAGLIHGWFARRTSSRYQGS
ncbi:MAG: class I SAM-dependent methyltransferase [Verrucomicrobiales bacterium]